MPTLTSTCGKAGTVYRGQDHTCTCAVPRATKHVVHQCECKAGWIEKGKR